MERLNIKCFCKEVITIRRGRTKYPLMKLSDLPELRKKIQKIKKRKAGVYKRNKKG